VDEKITPFKPVQKNKRYFETVSSEIKKHIIEGVFKPGDKLPSEADLAQHFNVGRQTIREAMRLLELSGFIEVQKGGGGGAVVKNRVLNTVSHLLLDIFQLEKITIEEITDVRLEVEKSVTVYAINNADEADLKALEDNIRAAKEKMAEGLPTTEENIQFHNLLARATKNQVFSIVVETLMAILHDYHTRIPTNKEVSRKSIERHEELLEAVGRREKERAIQSLTGHLTEVKHRLQEFNEILENYGT